MKNIYIFNMNFRGTLYGMGTYIDNLIISMSNTDIKINLIEINADVERFSVETKKHVRYIFIPPPRAPERITNFKTYLDTIYRYVVYLLKDYISNQNENIFHLVRMESLTLAKKLKEHFNGKIVLVVEL